MKFPSLRNPGTGGGIKYAALLTLSLVLAVFVVPRLFVDFVPGRLLSLPHQQHSGHVRLDTYYAPEENLESIDVENLRQAHSSVEMFAYSLTDQEVIAALKYAATHGTIECLYLDNEQTANELRRPDLRTALLDLAATPNVTVRVKRSRVLQHTKAYVIDTWLLREGSANFSPSALRQQDNDLLLTDDMDAIKAFELSFQLAWNRPDNVSLQDFARGVE